MPSRTLSSTCTDARVGGDVLVERTIGPSPSSTCPLESVLSATISPRSDRRGSTAS